MRKVLSCLFILSVISLTSSCKKDHSNAASDAVDANGVSADAISYNVNTANSSIEWMGSKQTGKHNGNIKLSSGTVFVKDDAIEGGDFVIDMNTINVTDLAVEDGKTDLEGHLKGIGEHEGEDHFFNVKKYPEAKFKITKVSIEGGKTMIEGNLTIKETTKNIKFAAVANIDGDNLSLVSTPFIIDRTQWKVNYGSKTVFADLGDKFVNDEIELKVTIKATK